MYSRAAEFWQLLHAVFGRLCEGLPAKKRVHLVKLFWSVVSSSGGQHDPPCFHSLLVTLQGWRHQDAVVCG
jgi:hypothetical protein